jgi:large subunit ribosomal protein L9
MKVILLSELKGKGGEGDVVEVATGYAVNYLFPRKIAIAATAGNLKQLEQRKHNIAKRETNRLDSADKLVAALEGQTIRIGAKVGEEGQLFGSVTPIQVANAINARFDTEIDRRHIDLHGLIKTVGEHSATVSIYRDVKAAITVEVVDEKVLKTAADAAVEAKAAAEAKADEVAAGAEGDAEVVAAEAEGDAADAAVADAEADAGDAVAEAEADAGAEGVADAEAVFLEEVQEKIEDVARTLASATDAVEGEGAVVADVALEVLRDIEGALDAAVADAVEADVEERLAEANTPESETSA